MGNKSGCAFTSSQMEKKYHLPINTSIFTSELFAIFKAILNHNRLANKKYLILSDSLSSLIAMKKMYSSHPLVQKIQESIQCSKNIFQFMWIPSHINIAGNEKADNLAKESLTEPIVNYFKFSHFDLLNIAKKNVDKSWNDNWVGTTDNKLREIKHNANKWSNLNLFTRRETIVLTRLRIGHTIFTQKHFFEKTIQTTCQCGEILTVLHIFENCPNTIISRYKYNISDIKALANEDVYNLNNVLEFLKEIHIYSKI